MKLIPEYNHDCIKGIAKEDIASKDIAMYILCSDTNVPK